MYTSPFWPRTRRSLSRPSGAAGTRSARDCQRRRSRKKRVPEALGDRPLRHDSDEGLPAQSEWTRILVNGEASQIHAVFRTRSDRAPGPDRTEVPRTSAANDQRAFDVYPERGDPESEAFGPARSVRGILGASLWSR